MYYLKKILLVNKLFRNTNQKHVIWGIILILKVNKWSDCMYPIMQVIKTNKINYELFKIIFQLCEWIDTREVFPLLNHHVYRNVVACSS